MNADLRAKLPAPLESAELDEEAPRPAFDSRVRPTSIRERPTEPPPPELGLTTLDVPFELPERSFFVQLEDRTRRVELLTSLLRGGAIPPASAVRALSAALGAIETSADDARLTSLADLFAALRAAIGNLGVGRPPLTDQRLVDTLVFDEEQHPRDLVALAVETRGHPVRCAATYDDFVRELGVRRPGLVIVEIGLAHATPASFCAVLCDLLGEAGVPFVLFSDVEPSELADLAYMYGARRGIAKRLGVGVLLNELEEVYRQILDIRAAADAFTP